MAMLLTDSGATQICNSFFKKTNPAAGNNLTMKLFVTDVTPADTDTAASYTEAVGGGYTSKPLVSTSFDVTTVGGIVQASYAQQQFAFTGPLTTNTSIYGVFIVDADGVLICAEKAAVTFVPANTGDIYAVTPVFQLSKGTPT